MTHPLKGYLYKSYVRIWPSVNFYPPPPIFYHSPVSRNTPPTFLLSYFIFKNIFQELLPPGAIQ